MAEEQKAKYEIIYDMGTELYIAKVQLAELKEQDINARIMKNEMQDQLTANIKNRGQLESLPLIALMGEKLDYFRASQSKECKRGWTERDYRYPG